MDDLKIVTWVYSFLIRRKLQTSKHVLVGLSMISKELIWFNSIHPFSSSLHTNSWWSVFVSSLCACFKTAKLIAGYNRTLEFGCMWEFGAVRMMIVFLSVLALWWTCGLSMVYPSSCPMSAWIDSSTPMTLKLCSHWKRFTRRTSLWSWWLFSCGYSRLRFPRWPPITTSPYIN